MAGEEVDARDDAPTLRVFFSHHGFPSKVSISFTVFLVFWVGIWVRCHRQRRRGPRLLRPTIGLCFSIVWCFRTVVVGLVSAPVRNKKWARGREEKKRTYRIKKELSSSNRMDRGKVEVGRGGQGVGLVLISYFWTPGTMRGVHVFWFLDGHLKKRLLVRHNSKLAVGGKMKVGDGWGSGCEGRICRSGKRQRQCVRPVQARQGEEKSKIGFCLFILCPCLFVLIGKEWMSGWEKNERKREGRSNGRTWPHWLEF